MRLYLSAIVCIAVLLHMGCSALASENKPETVAGEPLQDIIVINQNDWLIVPHIYYKPETRFAYGVVFLTYFQDIIMSLPPIKLRPTSLGVAFTHTQNDQYILQVFPEFFFQRDAYNIKSEIQFLDYPDKYFGVGQDSDYDDSEMYTARTFSLKNVMQRTLMPKLYFGLVNHIDIRKITEYESGGNIESYLQNRSRDKRVSGLGLTLNYDTRDDIMYTRNGIYTNLTVTDYSEIIKSDYNYTTVSVDLRFFEPFWFSHVLACQIFAGYISGQAPFYLLSQMGGQKLMRGLFEGRYRDNNVIVAQAEYRFPLFWRLSACGFAGAGQVAYSIDDFSREHFVYTWGGGVRFKLKKDQDLNVRFDVGFSRGFIGIYATIGEAI